MSLKNITPEEYRCVAAACPGVYLHDESDNMIIVGKKADPEKLGLDKDDMGDDEVAVIVDKGMIEEVSSDS